jgi:uncharacterized protein (TIGR02147 family)
MAEYLRISSTMMSHIFNGDRHLSNESANDLCEFMGLADDEFDYFFLLVAYAKAGNHRLQARLKKKVLAEQKKANQISKKMKADTELNEPAKAIFYSNWLYAGIGTMTACPSYKNVDQIADHLKISRVTAQKVVDFLLQYNLCTIKNNELNVGPQITHIPHDSPLVHKHHQNWRLQGLNKMAESRERNLFFTSPMSVSDETSEVLRLKILAFIEEVRKQIRPSPSEIVRCLNIDWFEY